MKTAKEIEKKFRADLEKFMSEHNAEYDITDDGKPYGMHNSIVTIYIDAEYDKDNNCISEFCDFNL